MESRQKIGFVINSIAGTKAKTELPQLIEKLLDPERYDARLFFSRAKGDCYEAARAMVQEGFPIVVAVGGDGTVNEVGRALIHSGTALGIVAQGSGNGLARHLGIPLDTSRALGVLDSPRIVEMDYCTANDTVFFCTFGVGFDARVGKTYARSAKRGFLSYVHSIASEYFKYKARKYRFRTADGSFKKRAFLVTFANAAQFGYDAFIAPEADIQDGKMDVSILEPFPVHRVLGIVFRLLRGSIHRSRFVSILRSDEVTISRVKKGLVQFDGETKRLKRRITIRVHPKGLRIVVPPGAPLRDPDNAHDGFERSVES